MAERSKFWTRASLKVKRHNCSEVILSTRINIVPAVRLLGSLTADQLTAIYQRISSSTSLKELLIRANNHRKVPSDLLASALIRLEKVDISACVLSSEQLRTLLSNIAASSKLQHLRLNYNNLSEVPSELLVTAVSTLKAVGLKFADLTADQVSALYRMVAEKRAGRLKLLGLVMNNHSGVSQSLYRQAKLNTDVRMIIYE